MFGGKPKSGVGMVTWHGCRGEYVTTVMILRAFCIVRILAFQGVGDNSVAPQLPCLAKDLWRFSIAADPGEVRMKAGGEPCCPVACKDGYLKERMGTEMPMLRLLITLTTGPINSPSSGLIVLSRVIQWTMALDIRETAL